MIEQGEEGAQMQPRTHGNRKGYYGAELRTRSSYTYGKFVVVMKSARPSGVVSSLFTFHDSENMERNWNEIDIEFLGGKWGHVQFNAITLGVVHHDSTHYLGFDTAQDYHEYAFEWRPDSVTWFVDRRELHREERGEISSLDKPQKLMMNVWNSHSTDWAGYMNTCNWHEKKDTFIASYKMVAVYDYDARTNGFCAEPSLFEDFSDEDAFHRRWMAARHSFDQNM